MKRDIALTALTVTNLALLVGIGMTQIVWPAMAENPPGLLRGSGLEIVDAEGRVRASISIQPGSGEVTETALFRLIDAKGQPSVKISASQTGAGLSFVGGDDASYLILEAEGPSAHLKLVEPDKPERVVAP